MSNSKPVVEIDLSGKLDRTVELNDPPLEELLPILRHGIRENFAETTVEIVECPGFNFYKILIINYLFFRFYTTTFQFGWTWYWHRITSG